MSDEKDVDLPRTIGIIGGMGPFATQAFLRVLIEETAAASDQEHLHVLIDSDARIPDRSSYLAGRGEDPRPAIINAGLRLKSIGAELFVIPCNTANVWRSDIEAALGAPVIDWHGLAVQAVHREHSVGVLGTNGTIGSGAYQARLRDAGIDPVVPDAADQNDVMAAIYGSNGIKARGSQSPSRGAIDRVVERLAERGAGAIILACTELPLVMKEASTGPRLVDPAYEVARTVIVSAGGVPRHRAFAVRAP